MYTVNFDVDMHISNVRETYSLWHTHCIQTRTASSGRRHTSGYNDGWLDMHWVESCTHNTHTHTHESHGMSMAAGTLAQTYEGTYAHTCTRRYSTHSLNLASAGRMASLAALKS